MSEVGPSCKLSCKEVLDCLKTFTPDVLASLIPKKPEEPVVKGTAAEQKRKCPAVLSEGLSTPYCRDNKERNRWVLCRAWQLVREKNIPMKEAWKQTRQEAKALCAAPIHPPSSAVQP